MTPPDPSSGREPQTEAGRALLGSILLALQQEPTDVADLSWVDDVAMVEQEAAAIERRRVVELEGALRTVIEALENSPLRYLGATRERIAEEARTLLDEVSR